MSSKYKESDQLNLPLIEKGILDDWEEGRIFEKSISARQDSPPFVFYEGPPSANGLPGIHHVISRTLKDLVCRYKTMMGFRVNRKGGWDTHGLPVELGVEKELHITKEDIGKPGKITIAEYNLKCREAVLRYKDKWEDLTRKMGYWVDLADPYITFSRDYIETLWWCLKKLYDKDLLYESVSIQPYSPAAGTGLSSHELNQPGTYKDVKDTSCVAMFRAIENTRSGFLFRAAGSSELYFLAWTTTPWTLPSNLGLTVGPAITYCLVRTFNPYSGHPCAVILAKNLLHRFFPEHLDEWIEGDQSALYAAVTQWLDKGDDQPLIESDETLRKGFETLIKKKQLPYRLLLEMKGKELEECRYAQLLPFPANAPERCGGDPFRVIPGDFVTTEDGTGIVHTAPAFGADDYRVGQKYGLGILILVDREGKFVDGLGEFSHRYVKNYRDDPGYIDVNVDLSVFLKKANLAFRIEKYEHSYPHCWRTDKPILYYPLDAWFIRTTAYKDRMIELNRIIEWKPKSTGEGRFGNWLENMVDWNLSRSRFWGTPLPIWTTADKSESVCIGSVAELRDQMVQAFAAGLMKDVEIQWEPDLHKPDIDLVVLVSPRGKPMYRVPDLVDVWFDSGAMPYAQWHFPFENREAFASNYPADFICEGVDQTRGWFYTLHAIAALLKEDIQEELRVHGLPCGDDLYPGLAYRTVVSNGLVLDKNGNKMSKRLGNVIDPFKTIDKYGADATRWYLITNASPWDSLKFDEEGIQEVQRKLFGTLYHTYAFFAMYANIDGFSFSEKYIDLDQRPEIDRWILSSLNSLIRQVGSSFDQYEPTKAGRAIEEFVDRHLSNWYVRLSRRRFWKGEYEPDKISAYQTLYECLEKICGLMAPVSPFFSDWMYRNLNGVTSLKEASSIHLTDFPLSEPQVIDRLLEERMALAQDISSLVLSLRKKINIKVRQPLQKVLIPVWNESMKHQLQLVSELICNEVNVKELNYISENDGFIQKKVKANFQVLGKKLGPLMKGVVTALSEIDQQTISHFETTGRMSLRVGDKEIILVAGEVEISAENIPGWTIATRGPLTVALDIQVTPELMEEGNARELVNRIQKVRKDNNLNITDHINVKISKTQIVDQLLSNEELKHYICTEILADTLVLIPNLTSGTEIEVNDTKLTVIVNKKT
jgi:isoleucyl-tRNA synthetase